MQYIENETDVSKLEQEKIRIKQVIFTQSEYLIAEHKNHSKYKEIEQDIKNCQKLVLEIEEKIELLLKK